MTFSFGDKRKKGEEKEKEVKATGKTVEAQNLITNMISSFSDVT